MNEAIMSYSLGLVCSHDLYLLKAVLFAIYRLLPTCFKF